MNTLHCNKYTWKTIIYNCSMSLDLISPVTYWSKQMNTLHCNKYTWKTIIYNNKFCCSMSLDLISPVTYWSNLGDRIECKKSNGTMCILYMCLGHDI